MIRPASVLLLSALITLGSFTETGEGQEQARRGFLSVLREGQLVTLRDNAGRYEITVMDHLRLLHTVVEVGNDYVVIVDAAGVTETRIPIYSIKSIVKIKLPRR